MQCPFIPVDSVHVERGLGMGGSFGYFSNNQNANLDLQVNCPLDLLIT